MNKKLIIFGIASIIFISGCLGVLVEKDEDIEPISVVPEDSNVVYYFNMDLTEDQTTKEIFNYIAPKYNKEISSNYNYTSYKDLLSTLDSSYFFFDVDSTKKIVVWSNNEEYKTITESKKGGMIVKGNWNNPSELQRMIDQGYIDPESKQEIKNRIAYRIQGSYIVDMGSGTFVFANSKNSAKKTVNTVLGDLEAKNDETIEIIKENRDANVVISGYLNDKNPLVNSNIISSKSQRSDLIYKTNNNEATININMELDSSSELEDVKQRYNQYKNNLPSIIELSDNLRDRVSKKVGESISISSEENTLNIDVSLTKKEVKEYF